MPSEVATIYEYIEMDLFMFQTLKAAYIHPLF